MAYVSCFNSFRWNCSFLYLFDKPLKLDCSSKFSHIHWKQWPPYSNSVSVLKYSYSILSGARTGTNDPKYHSIFPITESSISAGLLYWPVLILAMSTCENHIPSFLNTNTPEFSHCPSYKVSFGPFTENAEPEHFRSHKSEPIKPSN